ncbi:methyltransferase domain-containing protein [Nonomuraea recticatena]|uniref:Methyltransferase domain-containing protein n=1 Tax=Nonomuraea recticatena TaxID=46178 RepID=A0ABP6F2W2_9ACTN
MAILVQQVHDAAVFGIEFVRTNQTTGAIAPSGRRLCRALSRHVLSLDTGPRAILEVGPGTGAVTRYIAARLGPRDRLDLVEANPRLAARLERTIEEEPALTGRTRLWVRPVQEQALADYDAIVCGLPFANFDADTVRSIFDQLLGALKPGGRLSFFGYAWTGAVELLAPSRAETRGVLRDIVRRHQIGRELVTWNVPPAWVHHLSAEKGAGR